MSLFFCAWQVVAVSIGHTVTLIPYLTDITGRYVGEFISVIIFTVIGVYMYTKPGKKRRHSRTDWERMFHYKQLCVAALLFTSLDALFAGMGFGLLKARFYIALALSILIITAVMVILGLYTRHAAWI